MKTKKIPGPKRLWVLGSKIIGPFILLVSKWKIKDSQVFSVFKIHMI